MERYDGEFHQIIYILRAFGAIGGIFEKIRQGSARPIGEIAR
jgi:hypothetical protein